jgi:DnaJ-class molecular chaperone
LNVLLGEEEVVLPHPEGLLKIIIPKNFSTDKPLRLVNKGYRTQNENGDFYVKISVVNNLDVSDEIKEKIKSLIKEPNQIFN